MTIAVPPSSKPSMKRAANLPDRSSGTLEVKSESGIPEARDARLSVRRLIAGNPSLIKNRERGQRSFPTRGGERCADRAAAYKCGAYRIIIVYSLYSLLVRYSLHRLLGIPYLPIFISSYFDRFYGFYYLRAFSIPQICLAQDEYREDERRSSVITR